MTAINKSNRFPVALQGEGLATTTYENGVWTVGFDAGALSLLGGDNPGFLAYDAGSETLTRVGFATDAAAKTGTDRDYPTNSGNLTAAINYRTGGSAITFKDATAAQGAEVPATVDVVEIASVGGSPLGRHRRRRYSGTPPATYPASMKHTDAAGVSWVVDEPRLNVCMFGALPSVTNNQTAIQSAIDTAAALTLPLEIPAGTYQVAGVLYTRSNLSLYFDHGATLKQTAYSSVGAFITNVTVDAPGRIQSNILIVNPRIDGSAITYDPSNTTNSENGLGFARDASKVTIVGGEIFGYAPNFNAAGGVGGKALGLDGGCEQISVIGTLRVRDCYVGVWVRGLETVFSGSSTTQHARRIYFQHIDAENCQRAVAFQGRDPDEFADAEFSDYDVHVGLISFKNCGHCPLFPMLGGATLTYKAGVIGFGEAQNVRIDAIRGRNTATYITDAGGWPAAGPNLQVGEGLSGPIGALFYGHGRNISIGDVQFHGDADALFWFARDYTIGDDAAHNPDPAQAGKPRVSQFSVNRLVHNGTVTNVVAATTYYTETPGLISGDIRGVYPGTVTGAFVSTMLDATTDLKLELISPTGESIRGSTKWIAANYTTTLSANASRHEQKMRAGQFISFEAVTVADDGLAVIAHERTFGWLSVSTAGSNSRALITYRTDGSVQAYIAAQPATQCEVATTSLSAGGGTDGKFTVGFDAGNIYISNRLGGPVTFHLTSFA